MSKPTTVGAIGLGILGAGAATFALRQQIWSRLLGLRSADYDVHVDHNVRVPMPDGIRLATDIYRPETDTPQPTVLIRTPYGRSGTLAMLEIFFAHRFAERGYNVVMQDVRGRYESEGEFAPYRHESDDGMATVEWIVAQAWSDGQIATWGQSYLGYAQWAIAAKNMPYLKAMIPMTTQAHIGGQPEHGTLLDLPLRWLYVLNAFGSNTEMPLLERVRRLVDGRAQDAVMATGFETLPLSAADETIFGSPVEFFREWIENYDQSNPYWEPVDFRPIVRTTNVPMHLISGWYDIFANGLIADYQAQRSAGRDPYLTIGPWVHTDQASRIEGLREGLNLFDTALKGKTGLLREKRVRVFVMGADEWRDYDVWPPKTTRLAFFLRGAGGLSLESAEDELPDGYVYDPTNPTPNVGGALLSQGAGAVDNRELEARRDVLTYTLDVLEKDVEILGAPIVRLYVKSSVAWTDFFGRITDVHPDGRSLNIADGIFSITPTVGERQPDGTICFEIQLASTAHRFKAGHQIRLQISSGAHPRFARNLGTGEPALLGTEMVMADQTIYHDTLHPSALLLPIG